MPVKKRVLVTINEDDYKWIRNHKEINLSGLVQKCIADLRKKYD